jgi:hypothetical protein
MASTLAAGGSSPLALKQAPSGSGRLNWCEKLDLLASAFHFSDEPAARLQGDESIHDCLAIWGRFAQHVADSKIEAPHDLKDALTFLNGSATTKASVIWCPKYGCALILLHEFGA